MHHYIVNCIEHWHTVLCLSLSFWAQQNFLPPFPETQDKSTVPLLISTYCIQNMHCTEILRSYALQPSTNEGAFSGSYYRTSFDQRGQYLTCMDCSLELCLVSSSRNLSRLMVGTVTTLRILLVSRNLSRLMVGTVTTLRILLVSRNLSD